MEGVAQRIRARAMSTGELITLGNGPDGVVLELTGIGHLTDGSAVWYEETLYRGDYYEFVNQVRASGDEYQTVLNPAPTTSKADQTWYRWDTTRKNTL